MKKLIIYFFIQKMSSLYKNQGYLSTIPLSYFSASNAAVVVVDGILEETRSIEAEKEKLEAEKEKLEAEKKKLEAEKKKLEDVEKKKG